MLFPKRHVVFFKKKHRIHCHTFLYLRQRGIEGKKPLFKGGLGVQQLLWHS